MKGPGSLRPIGRRGFALAIASLLLLAACGSDDDDNGAVSQPGTEDLQLVMGHIHPETGPLAFLDAPQEEGVKLAVDDINAAGGVFGNAIRLLDGDEAGDEARVRDAARRLLGEGADVMVGAASSGMSQAIIQLLRDNSIPQCSPSNTSPAFTTQENADFYFRPVPGDNAVAPVIASQIVGAGARRVAVAGRADDYGRALADLVASEAQRLGATVTAKVIYDPKATSFTAEVTQMTQGSPDAFVIVSFDEGGPLIKGLLEGGVQPNQLYGADGIFAPDLPGKVDASNPNVIDGMTVIGAAGSKEFNDRLAPITANNLIYGGQAYDCAVILALAAEAAGSTDGAAIRDEVIGVTKGGTACTSFAACRDLLADGQDIDYNGVSGPVDLDDNGDPTKVTYTIAEFQGGTLTPVDSQDVDIAELSS